jgi:hypothetical protein
LAVLPAKAGIQQIQPVKEILDPGFHRGDDQKLIFSQLPFSKGEKRWPSGKTFRKALLLLKKGGREGFLSR